MLALIDRIDLVVNSFAEAIEAAFAPQGALSRAQEQFRPRQGQTQMALAVAQAIAERTSLVVEAGTGVGKTYAYLVPALLSGQRVLVSTATRALQDQLFVRDLPRLTQALGLAVRAARLKGRSAYLCQERLQQLRQGRAAPQDPQVLRMVAHIERWSHTTRTGDLGELASLDERSPVWPLVTSTRDNCLGTACGHWQDCHVNVARRQALEADVVVINHHLLFADLEVRESGVAQLLPNVGVVVVDEAHQLNDTGVQFAGHSISGHQLQAYARDMLQAGLQHARGMADWMQWAAQIKQAVQDWRLLAAGTALGARLPWQGLTPLGLDAARWRAALVGLGQSLRAPLSGLLELAPMHPDLARLHARGLDLLQRLGGFAALGDEGQVRWLEVQAAQLRMLESPLTIARIMRTRLLQLPPETEAPAEAMAQPSAPTPAWIFTSATLGDDEQLRWFTEPCGLRHAQVLRVDSPFDYGRQAALYVPQDFVLPGAPGHSAAVADLVLEAATRLGGRCLVLTTTLKALHAIGDALQQAQGLFGSLQVLVQGQGPKLALIERFVAAGQDEAGQGCVLVASATFWEGVDLPGNALQLVVIDKLPFAPPDDPLVQARSQQLEALGRNAFKDYVLPEAAMALKQGAGRLIRRESDEGALVICDPRLLSMPYGRRMLAALPPMRRIADHGQWMQTLDYLSGLTRASTKA